MIAAIAFFALESYEAFLAGSAALLIIATVILGFLLHPRREIFYLRTTTRVPDPDSALVIEHNRLAVRVELARLWLLFIPTFTALAFLLVTAARGTTWKISLFGDNVLHWFDGDSYPFFLLSRLLIIAVFELVFSWLSERWVLRDASACSADSLTRCDARILYSFRDTNGEYYGGDGFPVGKLSRHLQTIVFYDTCKPQRNKIALCCVFHRPVIVGRGVTDLNEARQGLAVAGTATSEAR